MPSKELIEKVARELCLVTGRMGDPLPIELQRVDRDWGGHIPAAKAAISTILAALQEPTEGMLDAVDERRNTPFDQYFKDADDVDRWAEMWWKQMLLASPLGEEK